MSLVALIEPLARQRNRQRNRLNLPEFKLRSTRIIRGSMLKKIGFTTGILATVAAGYFLKQPIFYGVAGLVAVYLFSSSCGG